MTPLTGKDKRRLRAIGQNLQAAVTIGKAGQSQAVLANIRDLLAAHELIKVRLTEGQGRQRKLAATELADAVHAELAGVVGRTVLLYRANPDLPADDRIDLR
jgi:RNA-binding protein